MFWKKKSTSINKKIRGTDNKSDTINLSDTTNLNDLSINGAKQSADIEKRSISTEKKNIAIEETPSDTHELSSDTRDFIEHDNESRREAYRYIRKDGATLYEMNFLNKLVEVIDISAGGLSFRNMGFKKNDTDRVLIYLKGFHYRIGDRKANSMKVIIKIVHIDSQNFCHAIFQDLTTDQSDILHQYIFEKQKQDIRRKRWLI